jgi:hypothetical protein
MDSAVNALAVCHPLISPYAIFPSLVDKCQAAEKIVSRDVCTALDMSSRSVFLVDRCTIVGVRRRDRRYVVMKYRFG